METAIAKAGRPYQGFDYPGTGHRFAEQDRDEDFAPDAAALALQRTVKHLRETLRRE